MASHHPLFLLPGRVLVAAVSVLLAGMPLACDPDLPSEEEIAPPSPSPTPTYPADSLEVRADGSIPVSQAQWMYASFGSVVVTVRAFVVGTAEKATLNAARFVPPFEGETNLLLADDTLNLAVDCLFPVALKKGRPEREELNLRAHPDGLHRELRVTGTLERYFRTVGLRTLDEWEWAD